MDWSSVLVAGLAFAGTVLAASAARYAWRRRAVPGGALSGLYLDTVLDSMDDGVIVVDTRDRVLALNAAAQSLADQPLRAVRGQPLRSVLPALAHLPGATDDQPMRGEVTWPGPSASSADARHFEVRVSPLRNHRGVVSGRAITLHDVTYRKHIEQALLAVNEEHARRNQELDLLNRVIATTTSEQDADAVLHVVCRELAEALDLPRVAAAILNEDGTTATVVAEFRCEEQATSLGLIIPVTENLVTQQVLEQKVPVAVLDAQRDPRMAPAHGLMRQQGVASLLVVPLLVRGEAIGTIGMDSLAPRRFSEDEMALAGSVAAAAAQALENARANEAVRHEKALMDALLDNIPESIYFKDLTGRHTRVNPVLVRNVKMAPDDILGKTDVDLYGEEYGRQTLADDLHVITTGQPIIDQLEQRLLPDGSALWSLSSKVPLRDPAGQVIGMAGITSDITGIKQAEEALRESQQRLQVAIDGAGLGLWDLDLVAGRAFVDRFGFGYLGFVPGESAQMAEVEARLSEALHPDDRGLVDAALARHLAGETRLLDVEVRTRAKPGEVCCSDTEPRWNWILMRGRVVARDEQGRPLRVAGITQDITARKEVETQRDAFVEALRRAKDAAETANRAKSTFLANMSHELRTPLNAILGFAQLMVRDPTLSTGQRENLETIRQSGEHLLTLINDVLEVSKIEAGRTTLQPRNVDLYRLLADVDSMFRLRATDKGLQLLVERMPGVPQHVRCDESKLRQVLINLLSNAVKFTHEGGITVRVRHQAAPAGGRLTVEVQDTGIGIAADEIEALFDPFVQASPRQAAGPEQAYLYQEGTGLGLTISRHFVELMGGTLTACSEVGRGSTFRFDVVVEPGEAVEARPPTPRRKVVGLEPGQPVYRLLVVEDREANRKLLVKLLSSLGSPPHGFEIREACNGYEGLRVWEEWQPHLIWMDMRMPVMDGYEATRRIKATTRGQATVIVALTASAFEEDRVTILSHGCDDFVRKPFRTDDVFDRLEAHLGVRFLYEELDRAPALPPTDSQKMVAVRGLLTLPPEWVAAVRSAALQADSELLVALVDDIRQEHRELADAIGSLIANFRFDLILALAEQVGE